jgi:hypothetical protein
MHEYPSKLAHLYVYVLKSDVWMSLRARTLYLVTAVTFDNQPIIEVQNLLGCTTTLIALTMEAARTSETSVDIYLTTRQYIPEDSELHTLRRENLKSHCL